MVCFVSRAINFPVRRKQNANPRTCANFQMRNITQLPDRTKVVLPSEWDLRLGSPSKINLFLRVMGKRPDGYHELASLFQSISLHDTLYFSVKTEEDDNPNEDSLECDTPGVPTDSSNLVIKALNKFREKTGSIKFFRVRLEKKIPHEAGLGGGSSNAATALWAANELNDKPCTLEELAAFGGEFGSDISFFLSNGTAYCTGRGEILEELPRMRPQALYVVKPAEGLSTPEVFKHLNLSECSDRDPRKLLEKMQRGVIFADFVNDLEKPSFKLLPRLAVLKESLYAAGFNVSSMLSSPKLCLHADLMNRISNQGFFSSVLE